MAFILLSDQEDPNDRIAAKRLWLEYQSYLDAIRDRLPRGVWKFAKAAWHYDFADHRCPHDAWVDSLVIREVMTENRRVQPALHIDVRLLGAYHDGHLHLGYINVWRYSLDGPGTDPELHRHGTGHGDWLFDEIRLSERGHVLHEIEFGSGSRWIIECDDLRYDWVPMQSTEP